MTTSDRRLSLLESALVFALLGTGIGIVVLSGFVLDRARPEADPNATPILLQAPVTAEDEARAELATNIRDALNEFEEDDAPTTGRGGHRGTGRGWFFRSDQDTYEQSIADALSASGLLPLDDRNPDVDILVHSCGDWFAVIAPSTVPSSPADSQRWQASGCSVADFFVRDGPVFVAIGGLEP